MKIKIGEILKSYATVTISMEAYDKIIQILAGIQRADDSDLPNSVLYPFYELVTLLEQYEDNDDD